MRRSTTRGAVIVIAVATGVVALLAACQQPAREKSTPGGDKPAPKPGLGPADIVPADLAPTEACGDAPLLTIEQVAKGERAGERIAFDVVPRATIFCTLMACVGPSGEHDPTSCCNQCGGGYEVAIADEFRLQFVGLPGGCGGYDCNVHCDPFGREPARAYRFVGVSKWTKRIDNGAIYDKAELTVEKFCAAPAAAPAAR
jgi:hypothetical protein